MTPMPSEGVGVRLASDSARLVIPEDGGATATGGGDGWEEALTEDAYPATWTSTGGGTVAMSKVG